MNSISFEKGKQQIWRDFTLDLAEELVFTQGKIYQLQGPNGSGKSSFIDQILIPRLQQQDAWLLSFEQQASLQLQSVRAWAAIFNPGVRVSNEEELIGYLLDDLRCSYQRKPKPIWIVADELHQLELLQELELPHCLIFSAHHHRPEQSIQIHFEPVSTSWSRVCA